MFWNLIAEGQSPSEFKSNAPAIDLPPGTKMKLELTTAVPIAPLADLWGAEWVFKRLLDAEAEIVDVEGVGWNKIVVHMRARGAWIPIVIAAIVAICAYFGWQMFKELKLFAQAAGPVFWGFIGLIGAAIAIPLVMRIFKKGRVKT
jgi:hypothetical protein